MKKLGFNKGNRLALKELKLSLHNYYEQKIIAIRYEIELLFLKNLSSYVTYYYYVTSITLK